MQLEYDVPALSGRPGHWTIVCPDCLDCDDYHGFPYGWMTYVEAHGTLLLECAKDPGCNLILFGRN